MLPPSSQHTYVALSPRPSPPSYTCTAPSWLPFTRSPRQQGRRPRATQTIQASSTHTRPAVRPTNIPLTEPFIQSPHAHYGPEMRQPGIEAHETMRTPQAPSPPRLLPCCPFWSGAETRASIPSLRCCTARTTRETTRQGGAIDKRHSAANRIHTHTYMVHSACLHNTVAHIWLARGHTHTHGIETIYVIKTPCVRSRTHSETRQ
mmetsp:Transcript_47044/g.117326  ORF Transcript_47044/g.117326 Transcript_47044/m.117326 type:complete len:205 (-) Transcript_47044:593-1207(-)